MNYNTLSYLVYLPVAIAITIVVGKMCHRNGIVFIKSIINDPKVATAINNLLLVGYYLLNVGYGILMVRKWPPVDSVSELLFELNGRVTTIIMILAVMHYFNIIVLTTGRRIINKTQIKNDELWKIK